MSRVGCPEEDAKQSPSVGVVVDAELLVFALICPETAGEDSVARFEKGKLKARQISVSRSAQSSHDEMLEKVVTPQLQRKPSRKYLGFQFASCEEIRAIVTENDGTPTNFGAICVIDDAYDAFAGHARMGFSEHDIDFWKRNNREAARGNLAIVLGRRGVFNDPAAWP